MKYFVQVGEPPQTLVVDVGGGQVTVDGVPLAAHLAAVIGTPLHHLLLAGESWTVAAQPLEGGERAARWALGLAGERVVVEVVDERTHQIQALTGRPAGKPESGVITAPMPGLVVRIPVTEGQTVARGAGLVVVEAMKMENELRAPRDGVVAKVHVKVGEAVVKGAPLVTVQGSETSG